MHWLENHWRGITVLTPFLFPFTLAFHAAVAVRRLLYRIGVLRRMRLPVPVVVVGNISVGGTGKTPLVLWLSAFCAERGLKPGIVSRGYGGRADAPRAVTPESTPEECGDEPVLIARRSGCPVWIGADRVAAAKALLAAHPECDLILSDDGLQHYRLARDAEISVLDGARGLGNALLLPAGPLREPESRLAEIDFLVMNGAGVGLKARRAAFDMVLKPRGFYRLVDPQQRAGAEVFRNKTVHAVAGIGNPQRFFDTLSRMGVVFTAHRFPDHHPFRAADLAYPAADLVVMTEKDAVKCREFATPQHWVLRVDAEVDPALGERILEKIGRRA